MDSLRKELRAYVVRNFLFGKDDPSLGDEDSLMDRGIVDSTGVLEVIGHLEQQYGIQVLDEELVPENLDTVANMARFVARKSGT